MPRGSALRRAGRRDGRSGLRHGHSAAGRRPARSGRRRARPGDATQQTAIARGARAEADSRRAAAVAAQGTAEQRRDAATRARADAVGQRNEARAARSDAERQRDAARESKRKRTPRVARPKRGLWSPALSPGFRVDPEQTVALALQSGRLESTADLETALRDGLKAMRRGRIPGRRRDRRSGSSRPHGRSASITRGLPEAAAADTSDARVARRRRRR